MLVFYKDGSNTQIAVALVLAFGSLIILSEIKPYIDPLDNKLAAMALWVTILTLLASLMLRADWSARAVSAPPPIPFAPAL